MSRCAVGSNDSGAGSSSSCSSYSNIDCGVVAVPLAFQQGTAPIYAFASCGQRQVVTYPGTDTASSNFIAGNDGPGAPKEIGGNSIYLHDATGASLVIEFGGMPNYEMRVIDAPIGVQTNDNMYADQIRVRLSRYSNFVVM